MSKEIQVTVSNLLFLFSPSQNLWYFGLVSLLLHNFCFVFSDFAQLSDQFTQLYLYGLLSNFFAPFCMIFDLIYYNLSLLCRKVCNPENSFLLCIQTFPFYSPSKYQNLLVIRLVLILLPRFIILSIRNNDFHQIFRHCS